MDKGEEGCPGPTRGMKTVRNITYRTIVSTKVVRFSVLEKLNTQPINSDIVHLICGLAVPTVVLV